MFFLVFPSTDGGILGLFVCLTLKSKASVWKRKTVRNLGHNILVQHHDLSFWCTRSFTAVTFLASQFEKFMKGENKTQDCLQPQTQHTTVIVSKVRFDYSRSLTHSKVRSVLLMLGITVKYNILTKSSIPLHCKINIIVCYFFKSSS